MTTYSDVFGGANIYPSEISYSALSLTASISLQWPLDTVTATTPVTRIMDISANAAGYSITMPSATQVGTGETVLFNNTGSDTITINNNAGSQIATIASGTAWQIYLTSNSTSAGVWRVVQFGASTSTANASTLAGNSLKAVGTALEQAMPVNTFNSSYTSGISDRAKSYVWTGGAGTLTLPTAASVGANWFINVKNLGTGDLTIARSGTDTIDNTTSKVLQLNDSAILFTDGVEYYVLGFGQNAAFAFDYTVVAVSGATYTLSGSELNRIAYSFTGALTSNIDIVVPTTIQQYWVDNTTTGSYTLTVKTSAGTGVSINQGARAIVYCNGTNVVQADTYGISFPITVAQGGTNATTASAARINLGATTVGDALFTAASQSAAWSALGTLSGGAF